MAVDFQDVARRLFRAAETLWTNTGLRPDQYAQPVLALIALRQMEAKFIEVDRHASQAHYPSRNHFGESRLEHQCESQVQFATR
jgi:hypothetical protein